MSASTHRHSAVPRRQFLAASVTAATLPWPVVGHAQEAGEHPVFQATGVKVGEITPSSAIVWTRLTKRPERLAEGIVVAKQKRGEAAREYPADQIEGACPGQAGRIRVRYGSDKTLSDAQQTDWADVDEADDYSHLFSLTDLQPATTYYYAVETQPRDQSRQHGALHGQFTTAPAADAPSNLSFCVMTCQGYPDRDHPDGHPIYPSMQALEPHFVSMTGDLIYYDNDAPRAITPALARLHWERMFSLPRQVAMLRSCGGYWLKDDHDTLRNDTWPGHKLGKLTFEEGQQIFRQQTPLQGRGYRTFRWGRDLQIWLTDGRDYRSKNSMPDGPEKTIWGDEQKAWFKQTVAESDATWKVLISPTPLVGPDRPKKNDNHANEGFAHEGREIREWLQQNVPDNFFIVCGDRHWQYHSVDPDTGVQEFSVGPASNSHAGGTPGYNKQYHRFHRVQGGFLQVVLEGDASQSRILFRHHNVDGKAVYEWQAQRPATT